MRYLHRPNTLFAGLVGLFVALATTAAFWGSGSFSDEGSVCAIAQGILRGELPYLHYFNEKAPFQYFWTALVMQFTESGIGGVRAASALTLGLTISLVLARVTKENNRAWAIVGWGIAIGLAGLATRTFNNMAESSLAAIYVATAALIFHRGKFSPKAVGVIAGLLQGIACGFRQQAAISAIFLLIAPWHRVSRLYYFAGLLSGWALGAIALGSMGILIPFVEANFLVYLNNPIGNAYWRRVGTNDLAGTLIWATLLCYVGYRRIAARENTWVIPWVLIAALPFFARMDAFRLWPSTALLFGCLFFTVSKNESSGHPPRWSVGIAVAILGLIGMAVSDPPQSNQRYRDIAHHISSLTNPNEPIWAGPYDPNIYCFSNRSPASRFYFMLPWTMGSRSRSDLLADIKTRRPKLIVEVPTSAWSIDSLNPGMRDFMNTDYTLADKRDGALFFVLRNP